jgi:L-phenylalanine/L-methionine N-acetyltransferase
MTLAIRRAAVADAAALARHMSDPSVYAGLMQMPYPGIEAWQKRLTDLAAATNADLLLVAERDGQIVGMAGLAAPGAQVRRRHVMSLGVSVEPAAQGQGVGTALMTSLCDYADRWAGVLRIELTVYTDNAVAIRLYRNFGFELEGTCRSYALRDGLFVDVHAMARLHPSPPAIQGAKAEHGPP